MIAWLNTNQGFGMVILTAIYVVATIVLVGQNRKTLTEIKTSRDLEQRPYIYAEITKTSEYIFVYSLEVRNRGKSPAILKSITIEPNIFFSEEFDISSLQNMVFLPGQCLSLIIKDEFAEFHKKVYKFSIEYQSLTGQSFAESYSIPLVAYELTGTPYLKLEGKESSESALKNIAGILASMNKKI